MTRKLTPYEVTQLAKYGSVSAKITDPDIPIEYVTKKVDFCGLTLNVSPAVLIPRVETEELVELVVTHATQQPTNKSWHIADVGTGSGAIALALSVLLGQAKIKHHITATDTSLAALAIAKLNLQGTADTDSHNVTFCHTSLLAGISTPFDCIVANLPYIPSARLATLPHSVIGYEPHIALDGGPTGLTVITQLLEQAQSLLTPTGTVFLEVDDTHTATNWHYDTTLWKRQLLSDSFGNNRFAIFTKKPFG